MKNVLITGVTGFIGQSLVKYFKDNEQLQMYGHSRDIGKIANLFGGTSLKPLNQISIETINENQIETIVHLAGIAHDIAGKQGDDVYFDVNYQLTCDLYKLFCDSKAESFVFVSSIKAAVNHSENTIDENTLVNPSGVYGHSKRKAEEYIESLPQEKQVYILRPCMVHGPGNKGNLNLLYKLVRFGIPYPLGSYQNRRSFLSIENFCFVIDAIVGEKLEPGLYHLADDEAISTTDLVKLIARGLEKKTLILNIPKSLIHVIATIGSWLNAPFNQGTLAKLTESMRVSNQKILANLGKNLPVSTREGLMKTISSFHE